MEFIEQLGLIQWNIETKQLDCPCTGMDMTIIYSYMLYPDLCRNLAVDPIHLNRYNTTWTVKNSVLWYFGRPGKTSTLDYGV